MKSRVSLALVAILAILAVGGCATKPAVPPEPTGKVTESPPAPGVPAATQPAAQPAAKPGTPSAAQPTASPAAGPAAQPETAPVAVAPKTETPLGPVAPAAQPGSTPASPEMAVATPGPTDVTGAPASSKEVPLPAPAAGGSPADTTPPAQPGTAAPATPAPAAAATQPSAKPGTERSAFQAEANGFWPSPESRQKDMRFSLLFGNKSLIKSWKVEILAAEGKGAPVRTYQDSAARLPSSLTWDGKTDKGSLAPEGKYVATLGVDYAGALPALALTTKTFVLSLSPPKPNLLTAPQRLEPAAQGVKSPLRITIEAQSSFARIESWDLRIIGPDGALFRSYSGPWPAQVLTWDGLSSTGKAVEPGARYTLILGVADEFGHAASAQLSIPVSELPFPTAKSSVRPWTSGFSPNGDGIMDTMDLSLAFGYPQAVASWKLDVLDADSKPVKTWSGKGPKLPELISWDGAASDGSRAPEGRYAAALSVDYGKSYLPDAAGSPSFVLDATPPEVSLAISPDYFSPDGDGFADTLTMRLEATTDLAKIVDWSVDVYVADGGAFHRFAGAWPAASIVWDGRNAAGETVESAEEYPVVATVRDEFGNAGRALGFAGVDILLIKDDGGYRINVASIVFKGFTADYEDIPPDRAEQNIRTLNRLAEKLSRFPDHKIRLVGHAVMIYWDDPDRGAIEQQEVLLPLSLARADAIAAALAERGIDAARMTTEGVGASDQVVPDSDYANRWKNRRVVFFLVRE